MMRERNYIRRFFYGKSTKLEEEIEEGICEYRPPVTIPDDFSNDDYKVLYAVAHL